MLKAKHLIIEGTDRSGKDTLIKSLLSHCDNAIITHFSRPFGSSDHEKRVFQENSFAKEFTKACVIMDSSLYEMENESELNLIIWNRAHLGEFVYGTLYRNTKPEEWVMQLEKDFEYDVRDNVYLVLMTASPEFLSMMDDGKSFSSFISSKKKELSQFRTAFELSKIKKKKEITVERDGKYVPTEEILENILNFLNT